MALRSLEMLLEPGLCRLDSAAGAGLGAAARGRLLLETELGRLGACLPLTPIAERRN